MNLAHAKTADVLTLWSGLEYNRRALYLQKCAKAIINEYRGDWPEDEKELMKLPGIGKYTASAIACFAFNRQITVIDTNVRKVILVEFILSDPSEGKKNDSRFHENDKLFSD